MLVVCSVLVSLLYCMICDPEKYLPLTMLRMKSGIRDDVCS